MPYRSQFFWLACSCTVAACGSSPQLSTSSELATYREELPPKHGTFRSTGQHFYLSTGCSPHSTSVELNVHFFDVSVGYSEMNGTARMLTLDLSSHLIAQMLSDIGDTGRLQMHTQKLLPPRSGGDREAYFAAFHELRDGVALLQKGNLCFPGVFYLQDLADYLEHTMAVEANR